MFISVDCCEVTQRREQKGIEGGEEEPHGSPGDVDAGTESEPCQSFGEQVERAKL